MFNISSLCLMKKNILSTFILVSIWFNLAAQDSKSYYYDFYKVSPSGDKLYYRILSSTDHTVSVCSPTNGTHNWQGFTKPSGNVIIPEQVTNGSTTYTVVRVNSYVFLDCSAITSVQIPNTVELIGANAFKNCNLITSITLPSNLKTIWNNAFENTGLTTVHIPSEVSHISWSVFNKCPNLSSVTVSAYNTHYRSVNGLLYSYSGDTLFAFPHNAVPSNGIITEEYWVLNPTIICDGIYNNELLEEVTLPSNLKRLTSLNNCPNLKKIVIGANIETLNMLEVNPSLEVLEIHKPTPPLVGSAMQRSFNTDVFLYVPCGSADDYWNSQYFWPRFDVISEILPFSAASASQSQGSVVIITKPTCYNKTAVVKALPEYGYKFDHWSTGSTVNPYTFTAEPNMTLVGYFKPDTGTDPDPVSVDDVEKKDIVVHCNERMLTVKGAVGQRIIVCNMLGLIVYDAIGDGYDTIKMPLPGMYVVKVSNHFSKKIVVQ